MRGFVLILILLCFVGCSGGSGGSSSPVWNISGSLSYEYVPVTSSGLSYHNSYYKPIRKVYVEILRTADEAVLGSGYSDESGNYSINIPPAEKNKNITVAIWARQDNPRILVQDNTNDDAPYVAYTDPYLIDGSTVIEMIKAPSGWDGSSYAGVRAAAPFAIIDAAYSAVQKVKAARPKFNFTPLVLNWSVNNLPVQGDVTLGEIGAPHYDPSNNMIFLMGKEDVNTDEYDRTIVVHEWTHWFEANHSRSDNRGGVHIEFDYKDPTVSFSEGLADAMAAIVFDPEVIVRDTIGVGQSSFNLNRSSEDWFDHYPGYFSELSCNQIIFDIYDSYADANDNISIGLGPIIDVLTSHQKKSSLSTIYSFINGLKIKFPHLAADLDTMTLAKGIGPVIDDYGTGETNFVELRTNILMPVISPGVIEHVEMAGATPTLFPAGPWAGSSTGANEYNGADNNRLFRFTATSSITYFSWDASDSYAIYFYNKGVEVASKDEDQPPPPYQQQNFAVNTIPGVEYLIRVVIYPAYLHDTSSTVTFDLKME